MENIEQYLEGPQNTDPSSMGGPDGLSRMDTDADLAQPGTQRAGAQSPNQQGQSDQRQAQPSKRDDGTVSGDSALGMAQGGGEGDIGDMNDPGRIAGNPANGSGLEDMTGADDQPYDPAMP